MRKAWACLMLLGFGLSAFIHFSVYPMDTTGFSNDTGIPASVFLLHFGAIAGGFSLKRASHKTDMKDTISHTPKWAQNLVWTFGTYAVINFLLNLLLILLAPNAQGSVFKHMMLAFSGHWMAFYITPAMSYLFSTQKAKTSD